MKEKPYHKSKDPMLHIRIPKELKKKLHLYAIEEGLCMRDLIEKIIDEYMDRIKDVHEKSEIKTSALYSEF